MTIKTKRTENIQNTENVDKLIQKNADSDSDFLSS
jgi:hypothetical protein